AEVEEIVFDVENEVTRPRKSADSLARWLRLKFAVREQLEITTIGSIDVSKRKRRALRKAKDRARQERKRRARGARPHSESLSQTQPTAATRIWRKTKETSMSETKKGLFETASEVAEREGLDSGALHDYLFALVLRQWPRRGPRSVGYGASLTASEKDDL